MVNGAVVLMLGSISAPYTRVFVTPYSSMRERSRAQMTSKSSALLKPPPAVPRSADAPENWTSSNERRRLARVAVEREMKRKPRRSVGTTAVRVGAQKTKRAAVTVAVRSWQAGDASLVSTDRCPSGRARHLAAPRFPSPLSTTSAHVKARLSYVHVYGRQFGDGPLARLLSAALGGAPTRAFVQFAHRRRGQRLIGGLQQLVEALVLVDDEAEPNSAREQ